MKARIVSPQLTRNTCPMPVPRAARKVSMKLSKAPLPAMLSMPTRTRSSAVGLVRRFGSVSCATDSGGRSRSSGGMPARMSAPTVRPIMAPKSVTPMVPPICRKNWLALVTTPSCRMGRAFCTASTRSELAGPSPRPISTMYTAVTSCDVCGPMVEAR